MEKKPSVEKWLEEAKQAENAEKVGMYLLHNGVVRQSSRAKVRLGEENAPNVQKMYFSYDEDKVEAAIEETYKLKGIYYVRAWLNCGELAVGEDIMYVLVGGDIRPNVTAALDFLVGKLKNECVTETEYC